MAHLGKPVGGRVTINLFPLERTIRSWRRGDTEVRLSTADGLNRLRVFVDGECRHRSGLVKGLTMMWCHTGYMKWLMQHHGKDTPQLLGAIADARAWLGQPDLFSRGAP